MKPMRMLVGILVGMTALAGAVRAQEKPKAADGAAAFTQLKLQVILTEMDGTKKISSLPYVLRVPAPDREDRSTSTQLRMGVRVPIAVGQKENSFQYVDVGTNIDSWARTGEDGRFKLHLSVERSSVYTFSSIEKSVEWTPEQRAPSSQPILREFRNSFDLLIRDGQTIQTTVATDPLSGHVLLMDVTISVEK